MDTMNNLTGEISLYEMVSKEGHLNLLENLQVMAINYLNPEMNKNSKTSDDIMETYRTLKAMLLKIGSMDKPVYIHHQKEHNVKHDLQSGALTCKDRAV